MKKIELFMTDNRSLFIRDEEGKEYCFTPRGFNDMPYFHIKTKQEEFEEMERSNKALKEFNEEYLKDASLKKRKWWHFKPTSHKEGGNKN